MSEHKEQAGFFTWARKPRTLMVFPELRWAHAIPNGGLREKRVAASMRAEGVTAGVWDILLPVKRGSYSGLYIEMKYGRNGLTEQQEAFGAFVSAQGFATIVCRSAVEAVRAAMAYLEGEFDEND